MTDRTKKRLWILSGLAIVFLSAAFVAAKIINAIGWIIKSVTPGTAVAIFMILMTVAFVVGLVFVAFLRQLAISGDYNKALSKKNDVQSEKA